MVIIMIGTVMSVAAQVVLFILSIIIYVFLVACVFPGILLKPKYDISNIRDRGIKRFVFNDGRAITYQPSINVRKYVKQYILSSNGGKKYIKCKVDSRILCIKYDVVAIDSRDNMIDTIQIKENLGYRGYTRAATLPVNTAYVTVVLKEVNGIRVCDEMKLKYSYIKLAVFAALEMLATLAEVLIFKAATLSFMNTVFSIEPENTQNGFAVVTALIAGLALAGIIWLFHYSRDTKIAK